LLDHCEKSPSHPLSLEVPRNAKLFDEVFVALPPVVDGAETEPDELAVVIKAETEGVRVPHEVLEV
jgi:hypothetical protein